MANTQPARFTFSVIDGLGTKAAITDYALLDPAMTVAQLVTAWGAQAVALGNIVSAGIYGGGVEVMDTAAQLTALTLPAVDADSRVEQTGVFNLSNGVTPHKFGIAVAGLSDAVISAGTILIPEDGVVDVWLDILEETGSATLPQYVNTAYQALVALVDAFISFRKRRKQLSRSSRELGPD
jgi:hypothetical protein